MRRKWGGRVARRGTDINYHLKGKVAEKNLSKQLRLEIRNV